MAKRAKLEGLSQRIFFDRYANKDLNKENIQVGDTVIVITKDDPKFSQKEVGIVSGLNDGNITIVTPKGDQVTAKLEMATKVLETTPEHLWDRLAKSVAGVEKTAKKQKEWEEKFRNLLDDWKLVPGGRIAAGAGVNDQLTLFNCYVIPSPHDSRGGIMKTLTEMTEIMARGGGVGINLSSLRPRRALVQGVNGTSSGSVSWGGLFSYTTGLIEQGGSRRGALMLMLWDWHPDLLDFITVKQKSGLIENANLSVCVSNAFMKAVKEDADWDFVFPDTNDPDYNELWDGNLFKWRELGKAVKVHKTVKAREIWNIIIESAHKSAEPGVVFMELYNDMSNSNYFSPIICTNPCGEQGLPGFGVCNLSSINLGRFYDEENHDVAWGSLGETVRYSVRFLDNVIDLTPYHFEENRIVQQENERRVGLGSMGLAELLIKLEIRYGSPECIEFLDKLYAFMAREAYIASSEIAGEKGSFGKFEFEPFMKSGFMKHMVVSFPELEEQIRKNGMRNVTVITQAPTGSTGTMVGTSTGIEPYFAFEYFRQSRLGMDKQYVPIAQEWVNAHPGQELPDYFVTAQDLSASDHVRVQAVIQKWVDSSISKTANAPHDFTVEDTRKLYELAFELGCKGVTIYRDGSRDEQVLITEKKEDKKEEVQQVVVQTEDENAEHNRRKTDSYFRRPQFLDGATYKMPTPFGKAYITVNDIDGIPFELIVNVGKAGSDVFAMSEALGRICSLFLRFAQVQNQGNVNLIIKHLKGIGGSGAVGFGPNRVESIADAVAKALELHISRDRKQVSTPVEETSFYEAPLVAAPALSETTTVSVSSKDFCPSCGTASLINEEGCKHCNNCGYSRCG